MKTPAFDPAKFDVAKFGGEANRFDPAKFHTGKFDTAEFGGKTNLFDVVKFDTTKFDVSKQSTLTTEVIASFVIIVNLTGLIHGTSTVSGNPNTIFALRGASTGQPRMRGKLVGWEPIQTKSPSLTDRWRTL